MNRAPVADRFIAIHGHFYQPPREAPWLEALDVAAGRPVLRMMVGRALPAVAERVTAPRVAPLGVLVLEARRLGLRFGLWQTQNRVFALWRDQPQAHEVLGPLVDALGFALSGEPAP